jgi:hypothetical protein
METSMRKLLTLAMRRFLIAFGLCLWAHCAWAVQAIDGTPVSISAAAVALLAAPNFSTTGTNRIMRICTGLAQGSATGASVTVTSITDTNSLAWNLRGRKNAQMIGTPWLDIECWDALAAATQTNNQVVAHFSATIDDALSWYSRSAATTPSTCMIRVVPLFL